MKRNLLALLLLLAICGVAARYRQLQDEARFSLAQDLRVALEVMWGAGGQEISLIPHSSGVEVTGRVVFPASTSPSRQCWCFSLLQFAARRHGPPPISAITLVNSVTGQPITPAKTGFLPARPYAQPGGDDARAEIVRREAQQWLDRKFGEQRALALVDCQTRTVKDFEPSYDTVHYNLMGYAPHPKSQRSGSHSETSTTLVVVLDGRAPDLAGCQQRLRELGSSPRMVVLP